MKINYKIIILLVAIAMQFIGHSVFATEWYDKKPKSGEYAPIPIEGKAVSKDFEDLNSTNPDISTIPPASETIPEQLEQTVQTAEKKSSHFTWYALAILLLSIVGVGWLIKRNNQI